MKYVTTTSADSVMITPQTVEECGLLMWLTKRFEGKAVTLTLDTTSHERDDRHPMLWVTAYVDTEGD